jgi:transcriptional regulator with XRE-family HTH domain
VEINRIRVVLAEQSKKNKWLAEQLDKNQSTVSQWCNNARQPSLENLLKIAEVLNVDVKELLNSSKNSID